MLEKEFEINLADFIPNATLFILSIYINNLGYLEDGPFCVYKAPRWRYRGVK